MNGAPDSTTLETLSWRWQRDEAMALLDFVRRPQYCIPMSELTMRSYNVVLEPDVDGGYVAIIPAFSGCYSHVVTGVV